MSEEDSCDPVIFAHLHSAPKALLVKLVGEGMYVALPLSKLSPSLKDAIIDILTCCKCLGLKGITYVRSDVLCSDAGVRYPLYN